MDHQLPALHKAKSHLRYSEIQHWLYFLEVELLGISSKVKVFFNQSHHQATVMNERLLSILHCQKNFLCCNILQESTTFGLWVEAQR